MTALPVDSALPDVKRALAGSGAAVLQAPPGAGKTTRVPLALLDADWLAGRRMIMLEPRRLAARAAATFMARSLGEAVGETVGYRVRMDSRVGPRTRIEVVTEGVLTRLLQDDPSLDGIGLVIFDEFHERSLNADLGLALCLEVRAALREDLRLLVMSATLDAEPVAALLGDAPLITSEGRSFPVHTRYQERPVAAAPGQRREQALLPVVVRTVLRALEDEEGSVLVFLPGAGEIQRVQQMLESSLPKASPVLLAPLYGNLPQAAQDQAILPAPAGVRKVVLATSIAETSLTIEGIRVVVDAGLSRVARFDPRSGMTRLETVRVSRASADQRRGRAGRLEPGVCYRCWTEGEQQGLAAFSAPEIREADLASLALDLALWGEAEPSRLAWLDPPPAAAYAQAVDLLTRLGALDGSARITDHGRAMAALAAHPRLAHLLLRGRELGRGALACDIAALLSERDVIKPAPGVRRPADLRLRLEALRGHASGADRNAVKRVQQLTRQWRRQLRIEAEGGDMDAAGLLLALAYPDRIAQRRPGSEPRYRLANGRGAVFAEHESLSSQPYVVVADLDAGEREARIYLAAAVNEAELETHFADQIRTLESVRWDGREQAVLARRRRQLGELVLNDAPLAKPDPEQVSAALIEGVRDMGLACLPWRPELERWRERVKFLRRLEGEAGDWPDVSDAALLATLDTWLAPYLHGMSRRSHLERLDLGAILRGLLDWRAQQRLDELAPTHYTVPTGSRLPIDYSGEQPVLAVRLQEMFGERDTPRIAGGRVPLLLHLLSPAHRPLAVTADLASFWAGAYQEVKKDMKGRYPKHVWPDDPLTAVPTRRAKPRA
jgi:ATP-dependent helicase HrpB